MAELFAGCFFHTLIPAIVLPIFFWSLFVQTLKEIDASKKRISKKYKAVINFTKISFLDYPINCNPKKN